MAFKIKYLTFFAGGQGFAVDADLVQKIVRKMKITPVLTAPDEVIGISNVKGKVVTVLSVEALLSSNKNLKNEQALYMMNTLVFKAFSENDQMGFAIDRPGNLLEIDEIREENKSLHISGIFDFEKIFYRIININSIISRFRDGASIGGTVDEEESRR